jgi:CcmD family protein
VHFGAYLMADEKTAPTTEERSTAFKPVEGGNDMQSGEALLVEAYAAIWAIVFVYLLLAWRRQRQLDARITTLDAALAKARSEADARGAD